MELLSPGKVRPVKFQDPQDELEFDICESAFARLDPDEDGPINVPAPPLEVSGKIGLVPSGYLPQLSKATTQDVHFALRTWTIACTHAAKDAEKAFAAVRRLPLILRLASHVKICRNDLK